MMEWLMVQGPYYHLRYLERAFSPKKPVEEVFSSLGEGYLEQEQEPYQLVSPGATLQCCQESESFAIQVCQFGPETYPVRLPRRLGPHEIVVASQYHL
jgi:hypothetical protein